MRPREWRNWSLRGSPKREDHFCFPRESCIAENRTQLEGEGTKEVMPPTPCTIQSFACGAPPFKPLRIAFLLGFLLPALLELQVHCQLSLEGDKGDGWRKGGKRERDSEAEQREGADSSQAKTSSRKLYILKYTVLIFPAQERCTF